MFAGHIGVALAIGRVERRVNVGVFVTAALLLDLALWSFVLLGWELVGIPGDFASTHQAQYVFPYSHGLLAAVLWSVVAAAAAYAAFASFGATKRRVAALVLVAVLSHWFLDVLVHRPELPLTNAASYKFGLALWRNIPTALVLEAAIVLAGLSLFVPGSRLSRVRLTALTLLSLASLALTVAGMTVAPAPPSPLAMAGSSLVVLVVVCVLAYWIGSANGQRQA